MAGERRIRDIESAQTVGKIMNKLSLHYLLIAPMLIVGSACAVASDADRPYEFVPGRGTDYARSDANVFHWTCTSAPQLTSRQCWEVMPGMATQSFAPISFISSDAHSALPSHYYKDEHGVYYERRKLEGVDPATFKAINTDWAKTPRGVVYAGALRPEIDPATLQILEHGWARDAGTAYYSGNAVAAANAASLRILSPDFALDNAHVFYRANVVADEKGEPDIATFEALGRTGYAKDARSVFHQDRRIAAADRGSFVLIDNRSSDCYARDAHRVYYCGNPVALGDTESFVVLDSFFAIDNDRVYFSGAPVATADRNTFRPFQPEDAPPAEVRANAEDAKNWYEVVASDLVVTPKGARHP